MALQQLMYQLFKIVQNCSGSGSGSATYNSFEKCKCKCHCDCNCVLYILIYIQEKGIFSGLYLYLYSADLLCIWLEAYVSQSNTCTCLLTVTNILNTHLQVRDGCTRRVLHTVTSTYTVCSLYILIQIIVYANVNAKMLYKRALLQRLGR